MKGFFAFIFDLAKVVLIAAVIIVPIRYFLVQPFFVKGASMEPNFVDGEYLLIDEISYRLGEPQRGEVIVFRYPLDPVEFYIKRVVGLPGETVEVTGGHVIIYNQQNPQGLTLRESYLPGNGFTPEEGRYVLGGDQYYVLGDNRSASFDSRKWGPLKKEYIIGRAWLRAWPIAQAGVVPEPSY